MGNAQPTQQAATPTKSQAPVASATFGFSPQEFERVSSVLNTLLQKASQQGSITVGSLQASWREMLHPLPEENANCIFDYFFIKLKTNETTAPIKDIDKQQFFQAVNDGVKKPVRQQKRTSSPLLYLLFPQKEAEIVQDCSKLLRLFKGNQPTTEEETYFVDIATHIVSRSREIFLDINEIPEDAAISMSDDQKKVVIELCSFFPSFFNKFFTILAQQLLRESIQLPISACRQQGTQMKLTEYELWCLSNAISYNDNQILEGDSNGNLPAWTLLYDSNSNGRSVGRLSDALLGYESSSVMLVFEKCEGDKKQQIFGAYVPDSWKPGASYFGSAKYPNFFLFSLRPKFRVFRPTGIAQNYAYLNAGGHKSKPSTTNVPPDGVAFGGQMNFFRLFLDDDLHSGTSSNACSTYEKGTLRDNCTSEKFEIDHLEIWGIGGEQSVQAQMAYRQRHEQLALKERKVNVKRMMLGNDAVGINQQAKESVDMKILEMAGVHTSYNHEADHV